MDQRPLRSAEPKGASRDNDSLADQLRAMIAGWHGIDAPRKDQIIAGFQSVIVEGGIPLEEVEAWVTSWDNPEELPPPQPRK